MNETEQDLLKTLQGITCESKHQQKLDEDRIREERRLQAEADEIAFQNRMKKLEDYAKTCAVKGEEFMSLGKVDFSNIFSSSDDYTKYEPSMLVGDLKRTADYFEKKGFRIIFKHHEAEHDYDADCNYVAVSWATNKI
jgi:hypothetical protein